MLYTKDKLPTKERILNAAFSFFEHLTYEMPSLSDIAEKAGISKSAIFRHFKNKDDLVDAMKARVFDTLADGQKDIITKSDAQKDIWKAMLRNGVFTFAMHPKYFRFFLLISATMQNGVETLHKELLERGIDLYDKNVISHTKESIQKSPAVRYVLESMIFFIEDAARYENVFNIDNIHEYVNKIVNIIENGIYEETDYLSLDQMHIIEEKCSKNDFDMPSQDPIFTAISRVIVKKGFPNVTIKAVASELGIANSSLYTYFDSKGQMLHDMIQKELGLFTKFVINTAKNIKRGADERYAVMKAEIDFFIARPAFVPVLIWLVITGETIPEEDICKKLGIDTSTFDNPLCNVTRFHLTQGWMNGWCNTLAITIYTEGIRNGAGENWMKQSVRQYFYYIQRGIEGGSLDAFIDTGV